MFGISWFENLVLRFKLIKIFCVRLVTSFIERGDGNLNLLQVWLDNFCYDDCVCGEDLNMCICFGSFLLMIIINEGDESWMMALLCV